VVKHYQPRKYDYPEFEDSFRALLRDAEAAADVSKHAPAQRKQAVANGTAVCGRCLSCHHAHVASPCQQRCCRSFMLLRELHVSSLLFRIHSSHRAALHPVYCTGIIDAVTSHNRAALGGTLRMVGCSLCPCSCCASW
jgi:hypothetical protein